MREIKFRVWHKQMNKMLDNDWLIAANVIYSKMIDNKEVELMQFTELSDNKGKEIYESDIINVTNCECTGYDDQGNEIYVDCIGKVLFEDGTFVFDGHSAGTIPLSAFISEMKVIGNIYQNPELLNQ